MPVVAVVHTKNVYTPRVRIMYQITVLIAFFILLNFAVAGMLMQMESLSYVDAFYTSLSMSLLSGYVGVNTTPAKWFVCFYQIFGSIFWSYVCTITSVAMLDQKLFGEEY